MYESIDSMSVPVSVLDRGVCDGLCEGSATEFVCVAALVRLLAMVLVKVAASVVCAVAGPER